MNLIPVNPLVASDGDLVSLASLRGGLRAVPVPRDGEPAGVTVFAQQVSVALAAKLGVGSIFASTVQAGETGFWLDAMAYTDSPVQLSPDNIVTQTRWGYGLRIIFRARQLDTSVKLNFAILGAAVELGLASAAYEVQTIGLGPKALTAILGGISEFGTLRGDTFHELNTAVIGNLRTLIADHAQELNPRPIAVQLKIPVSVDPMVKAHSEVFAMRRIREGRSLSDALIQAHSSYDESVVRGVYAKLAPGVSDGDHPPASARSYANDWLD